MNEEDEDKKKKKKNYEKKKKSFGKCFDKKKRKNPKIDSFVPSPSNASIVWAVPLPSDWHTVKLITSTY